MNRCPTVTEQTHGAISQSLKSEEWWVSYSDEEGSISWKEIVNKIELNARNVRTR